MPSRKRNKDNEGNKDTGKTKDRSGGTEESTREEVSPLEESKQSSNAESHSNTMKSSEKTDVQSVSSSKHPTNFLSIHFNKHSPKAGKAPSEISERTSDGSTNSTHSIVRSRQSGVGSRLSELPLLMGKKKNKGKLLIGIEEEPVNKSNKKQTKEVNTSFRDELVNMARKKSKSPPAGILAVHIKQGHINRLLLNKLFPPHLIFHKVAMYIRVTTIDQAKFTKAYRRLKAPTCVLYDELKFFVISLDPREQNYYYVRFEVMVFNTLDKKEAHHQLASRELDLLPIIFDGCIERKVEIWTPNIQLDLDLEITFAYGPFGFGSSNQFRNSMRRPDEQLSWAMFCRLEPPHNRKDTFNNGESILSRSRDLEVSDRLLYDQSAEYTRPQADNQLLQIPQQLPRLLQIPQLGQQSYPMHLKLSVSESSGGTGGSMKGTEAERPYQPIDLDAILDNYPLVKLTMSKSLQKSIEEYSAQTSYRKRYSYLTLRVAHVLPTESALAPTAPSVFKSVAKATTVGGLSPAQIRTLLKISDDPSSAKNRAYQLSPLAHRSELSTDFVTSTDKSPFIGSEWEREDADSYMQPLRRSHVRQSGVEHSDHGEMKTSSLLTGTSYEQKEFDEDVRPYVLSAIESVTQKRPNSLDNKPPKSPTLAPVETV